MNKKELLKTLYNIRDVQGDNIYFKIRLYNNRKSQYYEYLMRFCQTYNMLQNFDDELKNNNMKLESITIYTNVRFLWLDEVKKWGRKIKKMDESESVCNIIVHYIERESEEGERFYKCEEIIKDEISKEIAIDYYKQFKKINKRPTLLDIFAKSEDIIVESFIYKNKWEIFA